MNLLAWTAYFALIVAAMVPAVGKARGAATQIACRNNMQVIGQTMMLYEQNHRGELPPDLATLMSQTHMAGEMLVCPGTEAPTTQQAMAGKVDYIYIGRGLNRARIDSKTVVVYEPLSNHNGEGMNVLRADGSVEFLDPTEGAKALGATTQPAR